MIFYLFCLLSRFRNYATGAGKGVSSKCTYQKTSNPLKSIQKSDISFFNSENSEKQNVERPKITEITKLTKNDYTATNKITDDNDSNLQNLQPINNKLNANGDKSNQKHNTSLNNKQKLTNENDDINKFEDLQNENKTETNSTSTEDSVLISVYNDFVNSEYYILILATIILLSALIFTYTISHCCIQIMKCIEDNEQQQLQTTDESDLGLIPLN